MKHQATLPMPTRLYDSMLRFVNARRKEKGLRPLKKLPAGYANNVGSCPCAAKCGAKIEVGREKWNWLSGDKWLWRDGSPTAAIKYFDRRAVDGVITLPLRGTKKRRAA